LGEGRIQRVQPPLWRTGGRNPGIALSQQLECTLHAFQLQNPLCRR
jgi:hypothetical protein